jgi:hypothetical protein
MYRLANEIVKRLPPPFAPLDRLRLSKRGAAFLLRQN